MMDVKKVKHELIKQKESKFKGNVYHFLKLTLLIIPIK